jgi:hypothetical protein
MNAATAKGKQRNIKIAGILLLLYDHGTLLYSKAATAHFGLDESLGYNEYQLSAYLYSLFMSSSDISTNRADNTLHWIKTVRIAEVLSLYFLV